MIEELKDILLSIRNAHVEETGETSSSGMDIEDISYEEDSEEVSISSDDRHQDFKINAIISWGWEDGEEGKELHISLRDSREIIFSMISCY